MYYPFGLKHKGYGAATLNQHPFKFNGVELNESLDINWYEMDVRKFDPTIARWNSIDPITHHEFSPYIAFDNSPIVYSDPGGADSEFGMNDWSASNAYFESKGTQEKKEEEEDCCPWLNDLITRVSVYLSDTDEKNITNESIVNFLTGIKKNYKKGQDKRINEYIDFITGQIISGEYYFTKAEQFISDIANGESFFFNASDEYLQASFERIANMSANDWAYAAGYSTPDIAFGITGGYALGAAKFGGFKGIKIPKVKFSGTTVFNNKYFGYKSSLFGRYSKAYLPDGKMGLLNNKSNLIRLGWGPGKGRHVFRLAVGNKNSLIYKHFDILKGPKF